MDRHVDGRSTRGPVVSDCVRSGLQVASHERSTQYSRVLTGRRGKFLSVLHQIRSSGSCEGLGKTRLYWVVGSTRKVYGRTPRRRRPRIPPSSSHLSLGSRLRTAYPSYTSDSEDRPPTALAEPLPNPNKDLQWKVTVS